MKFDTSKLPTRLDLLDELNRAREKELQEFFNIKCSELMRHGETTFSLGLMSAKMEEVNDMLAAFTEKGYYVWEDKSDSFTSYVVSAIKEE